MDKDFRPVGDLTAREVPGIYTESLGWKRSGELPDRVDLSEVGRCDSSGLALLLEWAGWAREQGRTMQFDNVPDGLRTISSLSQTGELLGLGPDDTTNTTGDIQE